MGGTSSLKQKQIRVSTAESLTLFGHAPVEVLLGIDSELGHVGSHLVLHCLECGGSFPNVAVTSGMLWLLVECCGNAWKVAVACGMLR